MTHHARGEGAETHTRENMQGILPVGPIRLRRIGLFLPSLALFLLALELMKAGAQRLMGLLRTFLDLGDPLAGLGFGWPASYFVLSGSPIAAVSLALFDAAAIPNSTAFTIIVGSRMGGSLVVIFLGVLYSLRGDRHRASLLTGLLALIVTATVFMPAAPLGLLLLNGPFPQISIDFNTTLGGLSIIDPLFGARLRAAGESSSIRHGMQHLHLHRHVARRNTLEKSRRYRYCPHTDGGRPDRFANYPSSSL